MASGGRGGRGAALLKALSQQARKPGQIEEEKTSGQPVVQPGAAGVPFRPVGRGAFLLQSLKESLPTVGHPPVLPSPQTVSETAPAGVQGVPLPERRGRGLADFQSLIRGRTPVPLGRSTHLPTSLQGSLSPPKPGTPLSGSQGSLVERPESPGSGSGDGSLPKSPPPSTAPKSRLDAGERTATVHKAGNDGKVCRMSANYIRVKCKNEGVYQYHVSYNPQVDSKFVRIRMVYEHKEVLGETKAFDGALLFLPKKLPQETTILHSKRRSDGADIILTVKLVKVVPPECCTQVYNILLRKVMSILELCQVGRYYYNPHTPSSVPQHKLEVWPGYITAIQEQEGGLMLLLDASHRVLRTETVLDVMQAIVRNNQRGFKDEITKLVLGNIVLTRYNNKTYKIDDIMWDMSPQKTFPTSRTGQEITFIDYYRTNYNLNIVDIDQPMLLHRPKVKRMAGEAEPKQEFICLVPELCYMTGLSDAMRSDYRLMKDIASHTRVTPAQRQMAMKKFLDAVTNNKDANAQFVNWGLELDTNTIDMDGRVLNPENILFKHGPAQGVRDADWSRACTDNKVLVAVELKNWVVMTTDRDVTKAVGFIDCMSQVCPKMGIRIQPPQKCKLNDDKTETFVRTLREVITPQTQMVVIICPTSRDDRYSAIKKLCCVEQPVPSQVIIGKTISQPQKLRSVTVKIALQINCKLGGELWSVEIPMKSLMIVGIDVYHDVAKGKRSIAGFVASMNKSCTRYYSRCYFQGPQQELIDGLKTCLISALRKYHEINHSLPDKIIVYRDGVGDGQLRAVADYEVKQLYTCFAHFNNYEPKMAVVIVQKRINTRIFLNRGNSMDNPPPGSVIDHDITRRDWYDFFLVSQHVRQGTVSPTHYIVVHDVTGLTVDRMQRLTYKMTHLYYNWPGTVRVPAPCQYAHKLAYLVGQSIHKEVSEALSDRLFFL
ncbi:hypothetical protein SNE40_023615 [Patella caerulea]|uniref:Uncharacterized protein n=1 Tax=Patella caerulea TaxID=87958 RepID=A0AAN8FVT5_PATCE